jgi:hypothetical protein
VCTAKLASFGVDSATEAVGAAYAQRSRDLAAYAARLPRRAAPARRRPRPWISYFCSLRRSALVNALLYARPQAADVRQGVPRRVSN